jgi:adenosine deaminase
MSDLAELIRKMPKAELHLHIEGTLEPDLMFELASRNGIDLRFKNIDEVKKAYDFSNLQDFLDIYYEGATCLQTEQDFYDLTWDYLAGVHAERVRHVELFFDPQTHTDRDVPFDAVIEGIHGALDDARTQFGMTGGLILCFLRHLDADSAMRTLETALPYRDRLLGVGLDSSEIGNPPAKFVEVFTRARSEGLHTVAHAGEEGPPEYIWEALNLLHAERIDHGVRCLEDPALVERLASERIPLTVCPLSNVKLRVFDDLADHNLPKLLDAGLVAMVNSDDPAYFGGYLTANLLELDDAVGLTQDQVTTLARNSYEASFISADRRRELEQELDGLIAELAEV